MRISDWSSDVCSSDLQRRALVEAVGLGPIPAVHGVVRWRVIDLVQWLHEEFAVSLDETTVGRELKKLGYVKLTARPATIPRTNMPWRPSKKGLCRRAGKGQGHPPARNTHRDLVPGRGACRPEKQDHAALGETRNPTIGAERSADQIGIYLWCDLPGAGQRRRAGAAVLQYRKIERASCREKEGQ